MDRITIARKNSIKFWVGFWLVFWWIYPAKHTGFSVCVRVFQPCRLPFFIAHAVVAVFCVTTWL